MVPGYGPGLASCSAPLDDNEVVGEAADCDASVDLVVWEWPDLPRMDTSVPGLDGLDGVEATERR